MIVKECHHCTPVTPLEIYVATAQGTLAEAFQLPHRRLLKETETVCSEF